MNLIKLPKFPEKGLLRVVIETPKGSRNKFDYDPMARAFVLAKTLPEGMVFPYDFGFIPRTRGADGDPLDVLVLMPESVAPGCLVDCRVVAVIQAEQGKRGEKNIRNDRFIAVSISACEFADLRKPDDLPSGMLGQLQEFFVTYNKLEGKRFKVLAIKNGKAAMKTIKGSR